MTVHAGDVLLRLADADGCARWYCRDCAPAAVLARTEFHAPRDTWPAALGCDRCASCNVSRGDAAAFEAAMSPAADGGDS